jgi:hypothetical protein
VGELSGGGVEVVVLGWWRLLVVPSLTRTRRDRSSTLGVSTRHSLKSQKVTGSALRAHG